MPRAAKTAAPVPDLAAELADIRATLARQQAQLDALAAGPGPPAAPARSGGWHWKVTLLLAAAVLAAGGAAAYQYYRVLQSIIDQYPHNRL